MSTESLKFETLQLHAGQEVDPVTGSHAPYLFIKLHRTYLTAPSMAQIFLH